MNQKDLLLVGGGLIAGYVICKMMNQTPSSESFSANGADKDNQQYKFSGKGVVLIGRQNNATFRKADRQSLTGQIISSTADMTKPFTLKGITKKLIRSSDPNLANANVYLVSDSSNATEYVKTSLFWTLQANGAEYWSVWIPKESVVKI